MGGCWEEEENEVVGMKAVWTHWRVSEAGIAGVGSYYYEEK